MNKNANTHDRYKQYRDALRKIKKQQKLEFYNSQCERYKQNTKKLWSLINDICGKSNNKSSSISFLTIDRTKQFGSTSSSHVTSSCGVIPPWYALTARTLNYLF